MWLAAIVLLASATIDTVARAEPAGPSNAPAVGEQRCRLDTDCAPGTICEQGRCVKVRKHINVLYLFYRSADRRFTEVGGLYWHRRTDAGFRLALPLYYHFWNHEQRRSTRLVLPLIYHRRQGERSNLFVGPLQIKREPGRRAVRIWPLMFYGADDQRHARSLTLVPLYHRRSDDHGSETLIPPLLSYYRRDVSTTRAHGLSQGLLLGAAYWRHSAEQRDTAIFPLFFHRTTKHESFTWALPLTIHRRNALADSRSLLSLTPPLLYRTSPGRKTLATLVPPLYYHRHGKARRLYLPPLLFWHKDPHASLTVAGPLYWHTGHGERAHGFGLAPLLFYGSDADRKRRHLVLFPALWRWRSGERRGLVAGPWYDLRRPGHRSAGLAPLVFYRRAPSKVRLTVLPLLHYRHDHSAGGFERRLALTPLGYYSASRADAASPRRWSLLAGPWFSSRSRHRDRDVLFPLFWRDDDRAHESSVLLAGPYLSLRQGTGEQARTTRSLLPLLWHRRTPEHRTTIALPLGFTHRRHDGSLSLDLWGPLYLRRSTRGFATSLLPLAFAGRDRVRRSHYGVLFPIFWRFGDPGGTTTVAGPAYYHGHDRGWHAGLAPLLFAGRRDDRSYQIAFPAFWRFAKKDRSTTVVGPGFFQKNPRGWHAGLAPLLFAGRRDDRSYQIALPALWRFSRRDRSTTVAGPGFFHRDQEGWHAGLAPLLFFGRRDDGSGSYQIAFPAFWRFARPDGSTTVAGPLYYHRRRHRLRTGLLPLFHYASSGTGELRRQTVLALPLFGHHRSPRRRLTATPLFGWHVKGEPGSPGRRHEGFAGPLLWRKRGERSLGLGLAPLLWYKHDRARRRHVFAALPLLWGSWRERRTHVTLLPLFHYGRRELYAGGRRTALYTPLFGFARERHPRAQDRDASSFYLLPYVGHRSSTSSLDLVLPLGFCHRDHVRRRTSVALLGAYYGRWSKARSLHLTPLVSLSRDQRRNTAATVVFPLFWDFVDRDADRRSTVAFPFYWRFRQGARKTTTVFPLYWDIQREGGRRTTVLFPFYWRVARADRRTHVVLNAYYRHSLVDGTYDFHLIPLFRIARKRPGDIKWAALGGVFGYQRIGRNRYLKLLFVNFELEPLGGQRARAALAP